MSDGGSETQEGQSHSILAKDLLDPKEKVNQFGPFESSPQEPLHTAEETAEFRRNNIGVDLMSGHQDLSAGDNQDVSPKVTRRRFLGGVAALLGLAAAGKVVQAENQANDESAGKYGNDLPTQSDLARAANGKDQQQLSDDKYVQAEEVDPDKN